MFCPVCKYEFRRGFTHCNTCDVDLVDALPSEEKVDHKLRTPAEEMDSPTLLWKGASGGTFSAITAALDAAKIPYNREDLDARLVFSSEFSELEIWGPAANFSEAETVLDDGNKSTTPLPADLPDVTNELAAEDDEAADDIRHEIPRELYPEDATAEVWSGDAHPIYAVRVLPEDEVRAREIVRQVIDAAPP